MMTPQEAEARVFTKASFGGYNIQQVDTFLDTLLEDYNTLFQENVSLKSKMKLLVDKVEEYRATEDAMRRALHSAQKMADEMVQEAEAKKASAMETALAEARQKEEELHARLQQEEEEHQGKLAALRESIANEEARLEAARSSTTAYVGKLKEFYSKELEYIGSLSTLTAGDLQKAAAPTGTKSPAAPAQDEDLSATRVFDQIQFDEESGQV